MVNNCFYLDPLWWVFCTILIAGLFGGLVNSYIEDENKGIISSNDSILESQVKWKTIRKNLTFGLAASFLVPLFLNMISSDLIDKVRGSNNSTEYSKLFILASFCLVASIYSRAFISGISRKVMDQIENANNNSKEALAIAEKSTAITAALVEQDVPEDVVKPIDSITELQKQVLVSLSDSPYLMRTIQGIIMDTKMEKASLIEAIDGLVEIEAVSRGQSELGQIRWSITSYGRNLLKA
jgi:hypothetical protein